MKVYVVTRMLPGIPTGFRSEMPPKWSVVAVTDDEDKANDLRLKYKGIVQEFDTKTLPAGIYV